MEKIPFFDCDVCLGTANDPAVSKVSTAQGIVETMGHYQIDKALVYHKEAMFSQVDGNNMLIQEIAEYPALFGCAVLTPSYGGEYGDISAYFEMLNKSNIKAIRLFPHLNNYRPIPLYLDSVISEAQKYKMPVLIDEIDIENPYLPASTWGFSPSYEDIYELSQTYPKVNFIIISPGMLTVRKQFTIMHKTNNIYFDCSPLGYKNIEYICETFSSEKLVFSTGFPVLEPGAYLSYILYADISEEEKKMIAFDNICRLLGV